MWIFEKNQKLEPLNVVGQVTHSSYGLFLPYVYRCNGINVEKKTFIVWRECKCELCKNTCYNEKHSNLCGCVTSIAEQCTSSQLRLLQYSNKFISLIVLQNKELVQHQLTWRRRRSVFNRLLKFLMIIERNHGSTVFPGTLARLDWVREIHLY